MPVSEKITPNTSGALCKMNLPEIMFPTSGLDYKANSSHIQKNYTQTTMHHTALSKEKAMTKIKCI